MEDSCMSNFCKFSYVIFSFWWVAQHASQTGDANEVRSMHVLVPCTKQASGIWGPGQSTMKWHLPSGEAAYIDNLCVISRGI